MQYLGQINPTDFFTRLLCGIAYTGIAPESFYTLPHGPEEHFDGMPIDFVSGAPTRPPPERKPSLQDSRVTCWQSPGIFILCFPVLDADTGRLLDWYIYVLSQCCAKRPLL